MDELFRKKSDDRTMDSEEKLLTSLDVEGRWVSVTTAELAILVFIIIFFCNYRLKTRRSRELPPGPYPWPIIGNLHMLGELPHRALKDLADRYGPIMFLRLGSVPVIVVSSAEIAKEFLKTHDLLFASRPALAVGKYLFYNFKDVGFAPYGDHWRQMRKICMLELLSAKRIESFQSVREEEVSAMIRFIWQESDNGTKPVNVSKALLSLTANIIYRMLMGTKFSMDSGFAGIRGLAELMREEGSLSGTFYIGDFIPRLWWLDLQGIRRRMKKLHTEFDALSEEIIHEHIERRKRDGPAINDFVDVLLDILESANTTNIISRNDMKALLFDMLAGGTDTSGATLEWAMSEILRNPAVTKRAQEELESVVGKDARVKPRDLPSLEYLQCVVKETLRLHSPVPLLIPHESMEACSVAGYTIPAKTRLMVNAWAIGRDPAVWGDDALAFKPERFMPGGRHRNIDLKGQDFELIPFGSGRRGCPGTALALEVVGLALAQLLHCFDWSLQHKDGIQEELNITEGYGVTVPPRFQVFAVPTLRLPASL